MANLSLFTPPFWIPIASADAVIPLSAPTKNFPADVAKPAPANEPESTDTVAAEEPLNVKSIIPLPSVKDVGNWAAVTPVIPEPSPSYEPLNDPDILEPEIIDPVILLLANKSFT